MVSAFYIEMGGFAYDVSDISDNPYIAPTPKGFMEFVHAEIIIPDIMKDDDIPDRSNEDSFGKLLVFVQAQWMVINCIAHKLSEKPTTLIELNVIVQCSQPSLPTAGDGITSDIIAGRTRRHQGRASRPRSRRIECRPSSTVIGRLLYIFTRDIVGAAGLDLWSNGV
jgi:hypothetical protein